MAAEQQRYEELKAELQAWAAGLTVVCLAATFAFYGRCALGPECPVLAWLQAPLGV